jgi:hypothetical protein
LHIEFINELKMKKAIFLFLVSLSIFACKSNVQNESDKGQDGEPVFAVHKYKVAGLNDSIISDSIWRMLFKFEGIEELVLDKKDSLFVIKMDQTKVSEEEIKNEIALRGGKVLEDL